MRSKELKSKVAQLERESDSTERRGTATKKNADEVIAKLRRFYFFIRRKIVGKKVSFSRTCRELFPSDPYLTSSGMSGSIPTASYTFIATWPKVPNVLYNRDGILLQNFE